MKFETRAIRPTRGVAKPENITDWPKMVYRRTASGKLENKTVMSEAEMDGWYFMADLPPAAPAAPSDASGLAAENAALKAEVAKLRAGLEQAKQEFAVMQARIDELEGSSVSVTITEPGGIPEGWRELHHKKLVKLAKDLTGMEIANKEDAVSAIELEIERRGNAD